MNLLTVFIAQYLLYGIGLVTLAFWLRLPREEKAGFAVRFAAAGIIAVLLSKGIAHFYFDVRPFVAQGRTPLFPHVPDNGFPSDHTTLTMLAALVTGRYSRKAGGALILCSLLIGTARVASLVHSPTDILGSVAIAAVSVWLAEVAVRRARRRQAGA